MSKHPDLICLAETKLDSDKAWKLSRLLGNGWDINTIPASGSAGGIALAWRKESTNVKSFWWSRQVLYGIIAPESSPPWLLAVVYASNSGSVRKDLWIELSRASTLGLPLCIGGDFNIITGPHEKWGGCPFRFDWRANDFVDFINDNGLIDLGFLGPPATWCNNSSVGSPVSKRLDRFLVSTDWSDLFVDASVSHLPRISSDHCPLLLSLTPQERRRDCCFHFEDIWLHYSASWQVVARAWSHNSRGSAFRRLSRSFHRTKEALRNWSREEVKNIFTRSAELEDSISHLQAQELISGGLSDEDALTLEHSISALASLLIQKECYWRQRSRLFWLASGDSNSAFFHKSASSRQRVNHISAIQQSDGSWVSDGVGIAQSIHSYFCSLWGSSGPSPPPLGPIPGPKVSDEENSFLTNQVLEEEIWEAMRSLPGCKAPGVDGFNFSFFRAYWAIIKKEVIQAVKLFFSSSFMPTSWKKTIIILIPKSANPSSASDFRPISLCSSLYKICTKVLSRRLQHVLPNLVGRELGGFVRGRLMGDHILIASELQHGIWNALDSNAGAMIKVDLHKAFDKLSWSFLQAALGSMGFSDVWINWVLVAISNPCIGIKINGVIPHWFIGKSGLRQGCPLSPLLFVLCTEILSRKLKLEESLGRIQGFRASPSSPPVSHLFFADDLLLFSKASPSFCSQILTTLQTFCSWSGQSINSGKSLVMFSRRIDPSRKALLSHILALPEGREMGRYLGVPLITGRLRPHHFSDLQARILARIGGWRNRLLSLAGKICLVNYSIYPMLSLVLGHCAVPHFITSWLEKQIRAFLWDHDPNVQKLHLIGWNHLCRGKDFGGAGLINLRLWAVALRKRQAFRISAQQEGWWPDFARIKYEFSSWTIFSFDYCSSRNWKMFARVGRTLEGQLRLAFSEDEGAFELAWGDSFLVNPRVKDFYLNELENDPLMHTAANFRPELLCFWKSKCSPTLKLFLWRICIGRVPVRAVLSRWLNIPDDCPRCPSILESLDHVLFDCPYAIQVWTFVRARWPNLRWPCSVEDFLEIAFSRGNAGFHKAWLLIVAAVLWAVWKERNECIFRNSMRPARSTALSAFAAAEEIFFLDPGQPCGRVVRRSFIDLPQSPIPWTTPPHGALKLNFDGAWSLRSGLGFSIRDSSGNFLAAGAAPSNASSALVAEILAVCWALEEFRRFVWSGNLLIEGDSLTAISWLAGESGSLLPALLRARAILASLRRYQLIWIPREANVIADDLARFGKSLVVKKVWNAEQPPPGGICTGLDAQVFVVLPDP